MIEFQAWPKTPRLFRDMIVTEKIDGTNAAVIIEKVEHGDSWDPTKVARIHSEDGGYLVAAQSRKRLITPEDDNFGFARWVHENAADLVSILGPGRHFGEWWGSGIQRGYGLTNGEKRFSLFNVNRYGMIHQNADANEIGLDVVPVLYTGPFATADAGDILIELAGKGSHAAPGFMKPEGIVVFHEAAGQVFKATLDNDAEPKGLMAA